MKERLKIYYMTLNLSGFERPFIGSISMEVFKDQLRVVTRHAGEPHKSWTFNWFLTKYSLKCSDWTEASRKPKVNSHGVAVAILEKFGVVDRRCVQTLFQAVEQMAEAIHSA